MNGIVVSIRYHEDIISIWNRNADDPEAKIRIQFVFFFFFFFFVFFISIFI